MISYWERQEEEELIKTVIQLVIHWLVAIGRTEMDIWKPRR